VPTAILLHRVQTPEPMAVEPVLMRDNGLEVSVSPHPPPASLEGCYIDL